MATVLVNPCPGVDSPREEVQPQEGCGSQFQKPLKISVAVAVDHLKELSDADLRVVIGMGKIQDKAGA